MWADSHDTMVIPGPERAKHLVVGSTYWMSHSKYGLQRVKLLDIHEIYAVVRVQSGDDTVRLSETSFYTEKPR